MIGPGLINTVCNALLAGSPAAWSLGDVVTLAGPEKANPLAASLSAAITLTPSGQALQRELYALFKGPRRITIRLLATNQELLIERANFTNTRVNPAEDSGVLGFTTMFVKGGASSDEDAQDVVRQADFIILAYIPKDRKQLQVQNIEEWQITSEPYRRFRLAITIYHELLHVWWARMRADPHTDLVISEPYEYPTLTETGHGGDTSFDINLTTLELMMTGDIEPEFRRKLGTFVRELATAIGLRAALAAERKQYR